MGKDQSQEFDSKGDATPIHKGVKKIMKAMETGW